MTKCSFLGKTIPLTVIVFTCCGNISETVWTGMPHSKLEIN